MSEKLLVTLAASAGLGAEPGADPGRVDSEEPARRVLATSPGPRADGTENLSRAFLSARGSRGSRGSRELPLTGENEATVTRWERSAVSAPVNAGVGIATDRPLPMTRPDRGSREREPHRRGRGRLLHRPPGVGPVHITEGAITSVYSAKVTNGS